MVREIAEKRSSEGYPNPDEEKQDLQRMEEEAQELSTLADLLVKKVKDGYRAGRRISSFPRRHPTKSATTAATVTTTAASREAESALPEAESVVLEAESVAPEVVIKVEDASMTNLTERGTGTDTPKYSGRKRRATSPSLREV